MSLTGRRIGPYEILAPLGAGGMGEVYRARDTKLGREVAIKVLPPALAADPDRLARFQREAQVLASLNHPNIAIIHGLEDSGETPALVLELVEGPTLADRIAVGALPIEEAVRVARQIAAALEAAHQHGVVHRDLKPANIKITPAGAVKVLDFGLAKLVEGPAAGPADAGRHVRPDLTASPTMTSPALMTGVGMILGTAAYMAPEQARGQAVDKRADIWAFGCVLFEMLTGQMPFQGRDVADTLASVLKLEPAWSALPDSTPSALRRLLRRTLAKEPDERLHDIADARLELDEAQREPEPATAVGRTSRRGLPTLAGAVLVAAVVSSAVVWWVTRPAPPAVRHVAVPIDPEMPLGAPNDPPVVLSPDGQSIVYVTGAPTATAAAALETRFAVRSLDRPGAVRLDGTEGGHSPFFSPDGSWVAFFAHDENGSSLRKVPLAGGPAVTIAPAPSPHLGASWGSDGTIIFAGPGLSRVSDAGGAPSVITTPDSQRNETGHAFPDILPNNRGVLFTAKVDNASRIEVLRFDTGGRQVVVASAEVARYSPTGHLVYWQGGRLYAVPFDQDQFRTTGPAVPVVEGVAATLDGPGVFSFSRDGSLIYVPGALTTLGRTLAWVDMAGREEPVAAPPRPYFSVRISPDGTRLAMEVDDAGNPDIWTHDLARNTQSRLTFARERERYPLWSADGRRVLFVSGSDVLVKSADGAGDTEKLAGGINAPIPNWWSRNGQSLSFTSFSSPDIFLLPLADGAKPQPLIHSPFIEAYHAVSPDERWIAYQSNESGRFEVYVRPFPDVSGGRWQITTDGGDIPAWSPDGRQLFFRAPASMTRIMGVSVDAGAMFRAGIPKMIFEGPYFFTPSRSWDIAPDGRFLMLKQDAARDGGSNTHMVLVQNWFEELKRLVPVP